MTAFLSEAWIAELDQRFARAPSGSAPAGLVVQYLIDDDADLIEYHVVLGPDRDHASSGLASSPDVTFRMQLDTAKRISDGELSTEEAFITGALDLSGDPAALIEAYRSANDA